MDKITFIVGAGASCDFGLPIGADLATQIGQTLTRELLNPPGMIIPSAMRSGAPGDYGRAARDVAGGMVAARSIDRYLASRSGRPLVNLIGKRAIVDVLSRFERQSPMGHQVSTGEWHRKQDALSETKNSWIAKLFAGLQEGCHPDFCNNIFQNISFVTFNYDRCIERYLRLAFEHILFQDERRAAELVADIPIIHIYGSLGDLPPASRGVDFGASDNYLDDMAAGIRTFTEAQDQKILDAARAQIGASNTLVFLGFGFDELNVRAVLEGACHHEQRMFATGLGLSQLDIEAIRRRLPVKGAEHSFLAKITCDQLIETSEFQMLLRYRRAAISDLCARQSAEWTESQITNDRVVPPSSARG